MFQRFKSQLIFYANLLLDRREACWQYVERLAHHK